MQLLTKNVFALSKSARRGFRNLNGESYQHYLKSSHWRALRQRFFKSKMFHGCCEVCGNPNTQLSVHHKTYKRLGREWLMDLMAVCDDCHGKTHQAHSIDKMSLWTASRRTRRKGQKNTINDICKRYSRDNWQAAWNEAKTAGICWARFCRYFRPQKTLPKKTFRSNHNAQPISVTEQRVTTCRSCGAGDGFKTDAPELGRVTTLSSDLLG
jgi:hypothetical protein